MALNNFYTVVNNSGNILKTTIDGKTIIINKDAYATGNLFETGENINIKVAGHAVHLFLPEGKNSWSTIIYNENGFINIFPSSPCQQKLSY